jgi:hypothetical protein
VQYLFGLAVVSACKDARALGDNRGARVRLKWPNDIYLELDEGVKKAGGILVNTSFTGGKVELIIGECHNLVALLYAKPRSRVRRECLNATPCGLALKALARRATAESRERSRSDSRQVRSTLAHFYRESWQLGAVRGRVSRCVDAFVCVFQLSTAFHLLT